VFQSKHSSNLGLREYFIQNPSYFKVNVPIQVFVASILGTNHLHGWQSTSDETYGDINGRHPWARHAYLNTVTVPRNWQKLIPHLGKASMPKQASSTSAGHSNPENLKLALTSNVPACSRAITSIIYLQPANIVRIYVWHRSFTSLPRKSVRLFSETAMT
jgi:hypothetical protein